jgi:hypothetical protein
LIVSLVDGFQILRSAAGLKMEKIQRALALLNSFEAGGMAAPVDAERLVVEIFEACNHLVSEKGFVESNEGVDCFVRTNVASLSASRDGNQLAITAKGFFTSSQRDADMLAIVRGFEVTSIGQVHQSLFNPDLVREALEGDPDGEVKRAAEVINLEKVLDSGPAPDVEILSQTHESKSDGDLVTITARIKDRGKGIGRIEWRANGITAGVSNAPANAGAVYEVKQELALDPGENIIEVVAYNARNLLASFPAQTTIAFMGPSRQREAEAACARRRHQQLCRQGLGRAGRQRAVLLSETRPRCGRCHDAGRRAKKSGRGALCRRACPHRAR